MIRYRRPAALVVASVAILSAQRQFHGLLRGRFERSADSKVVQRRNHALSAVKSTQRDELFAPIIIGAGRGSTGTHLFTEATCELGFVSLHYAVGCLPKNAMSLHAESDRHADDATGDATDDVTGDETDDDTEEDDDDPNSNDLDANNGTTKLHQAEQEMFCPEKIDHFRDPYQTLLKYHSSLCKMCLKMGKSEEDPVRFREKVLRYLERIVLWGKEHKVTVALHDEPYPQLMSEILKIVQKHYGNIEEGEKKVTVKPILLLSERDPSEYTQKRIRKHGPYSYLCRPTEDQLGTNSSKEIAIETMNAKTLEGGAFDMVGCLNRAESFGEDATREQTPQMGQLFYSMKEASKLQQNQFIVDTMENYQDSVRGSATFSYNIFDKENRTSVNDLTARIKQSMAEALLSEDGLQIRMKDGIDFLGLDKFFDRWRSERGGGRITHRRRDHGNAYGESSAPNDVRIATPHSSAKHRMIFINIVKKSTVPFLESRLRSVKKKCKAMKADTRANSS